MCDICIKNFVLNDLDYLLQLTSEITGVTVNSLISNRRHRQIAEARMAYFILAKYLTGSSLETIGKKVNRDHSTVLHGLSKDYLPNIQRIVNMVKQFYFECSETSDKPAIPGHKFNQYKEMDFSKIQLNRR